MNKKMPDIAVVGSEETEPGMMTKEERAAFLAENVTREEVTRFIDGYINNDVLPYVFGVMDDKCRRLSGMLSICQTIIVEAGLISEENLRLLQREWERKYEKDRAEETARLIEKADKSAERLKKFDVVK